MVASVEPLVPQVVLKPGRHLRRTYARVLGIDLNPDHVAWCVVDRDGNPHVFGKIALDLSGSTGQNQNSIGRAVAEVVRLAKAHGVVITHEYLDFTGSRASLRYG